MFNRKYIKLLVIILVLVQSCTNSNECKIPKEKILLEKKDNKGRLRKKVISGYIPGEDFYLTISYFDTLGKVSLEYGAKPYGDKFKTKYKYDQKKRLIEEIHFDFNNAEFENYKGGDFEHYTIKDTIADFNKNKIQHKVIYEYNENKKIITQKRYNLILDSITNKFKFVLVEETITNSK